MFDYYEPIPSFWYTKAATHVREMLLRHGVQPPSREPMEEALVEAFCARDIRYGRSLAKQTQELPWQLLEIGAESPLGRGHEPFSFFPDLSAALAFCLEECDSYRLSISSCQRVDDALVFRAGAVEVARITAARFSQSRPQTVAQVERALKGMRQNVDHDRLVARLSKLPGLERLECETRRAEPGPVVRPSPSNLSAALRSTLQETFGVEIPLHTAQEITARMFGARDWQHMRVASEAPVCRGEPMALYHSSHETYHVHGVFRDMADCIAAYADMLRGMRTPAPVTRLNTFHDSVFITTSESPDWDDEAWSISGGPVGEFAGDTYQRLAEEWIAAGESTQTLEALLDDRGDPVAHRRAANRRLGIAADQELFAGDWLFTFRTYGTIGGAKTVLCGERLDGRRPDQFRHPTLFFSAPTYKLELREDSESGAIRLVGEHGREELVRFLREERVVAQRLAHFAGLRWRSS